MTQQNILPEIPIITIDGPSGVGKGTLSQALASHFNWTLLDSGAIYRVLALQLINHRQENATEMEIAQVAKHLDVQFKSNQGLVEVYLNQEDVTKAIRLESTGSAASKVATLPAVRTALLQRQRDFAQMPGLVADGRDMGTVVFPNAQAKLFIDASSEARAHRRILQLKQSGVNYDPQAVLQDIIDRDKRDRERSVSPLIAADDALIIDTTNLSIQAVFVTALKYLQEKNIISKI